MNIEDWNSLTPEEQRAKKLKRRIADGELVVTEDGRIVCSFCGGNCGQCGFTSMIGSPPPSMHQMVNSLHGRSLIDNRAFSEGVKDALTLKPLWDVIKRLFGR